MTTVDELNDHYAEFQLANGIARLDRGLNAAPHVLNADGKPLFLTGPDYDRDPLKATISVFDPFEIAC